jgi:hypothetical protein
MNWLIETNSARFNANFFCDHMYATVKYPPTNDDKLMVVTEVPPRPTLVKEEKQVDWNQCRDGEMERG